VPPLLLWIAIAGACGTLARYGLQALVASLRIASFPWGTLLVNSLGCFAFGLVWALAEERGRVTGAARTILLAGFMGAFTTWSSYVFETSHMLRQGAWWPAAANVLGQHVLGFALFFAGLRLGLTW